MNERFGSLIKQAREAKGLRAYEVADQLGIQQSTLSRYENGKNVEAPPPDVLAKLATILGLSETDMLRSLGYLGDVKRPVQTDDEELRAKAHAVIERMDIAHVRFALPVLTALERGVTATDLAVLGMRQPLSSG